MRFELDYTFSEAHCLANVIAQKIWSKCAIKMSKKKLKDNQL